MTVRRILELLPASLEWMVLFRLAALRSFGEPVIRRMFFLATDLDLAGIEFAVLTSAGRFVAKGDQLLHAHGPEPVDPPPDATLSLRFASQIGSVDVDGADCLGLGQKAPFPPVLLHLKVEAGVGCATTLFQGPPDTSSYELLPAVGVKYIGGQERDGMFAASFEHRLPAHIEAGELSGFSRTGHCNEFFLRHGNIDRDLEIGLVRAANDRISSGADRAARLAWSLADRACGENLAMTCEPPAPVEPFPYGDLVPLGFLMRALGGKHAGLRTRLLAARENNLWAFHSGRLTTATDSALVLQGLDIPESVEALERFADPSGAYYPQLWGSERTRDRMQASEANEHWCQPDFATTCLIRALRRRAGLPCRTPLSYIENHFESRAGLYFANPYLTDWCVAEALRTDPAAGLLKQRLAAEILASANPDGTFGRFDPALSTSFAILALAAAGYRGRRLMIAQLRLLEFENLSQTGSRPFYSTLLLPREFRILSAFAPDGREIRPGWVACSGQLHEVSLYRDKHGLIGLAAVALALKEASFPRLREPDFPPVQQDARSGAGRYRCSTQAAYIGRFALRPYVGRVRKAVA